MRTTGNHSNTATHSGSIIINNTRVRVHDRFCQHCLAINQVTSSLDFNLFVSKIYTQNYKTDGNVWQYRDENN